MKELYKEGTDEICADNLKNLRKILRENQTDFWYRFGVTQSRGSRFEKGVGIPTPVAILLELYLENKVNDLDLLTAIHNSNRPMGLDLKIQARLGGDD